jgi:hypothetical protein
MGKDILDYLEKAFSFMSSHFFFSFWFCGQIFEEIKGKTLYKRKKSFFLKNM